ncbi:MAG TPA: HD-GYP domain-containing protein [Gaiellaceae bacterium]|jgi:putative nucleotidyltransferase with HDIG domain|nr:HD-GYP domain-containing protein [Gaiellaceae bacterium]
MRRSTTEHVVPALTLGAAAALLPFAALLFLSHRHAHFGAQVHFRGVGLTALAAAVAAVALTIAGARRRDGRTVLVGTAFSVMASLLALHGIATPGVLIGMNGVVAFTGGATLPVGAAVLALSALPALRRPRSLRTLLVLQVLLLAAVTSLGTIGMLIPSAVPSVPATGSPAALTLLAIGLALFGLLTLRAIRTFLLTRRRADLVVAVGIVWLASALPPAMLLNFMELGWWLGHGFELLGIVVVGVPVALDLRRAAQSRPLVGDVCGVDLVTTEEAFLGAHVRALTVCLAQKDEYTEEHTRRVALRAVQVGEELGLSRGRLRALATGGLVHDIGKLSVPDAVLQKPGPLTDEEFDIVKRHPEWGEKMLVDLGFTEDVRQLVRDHHERLDGSGYPHGASGSLISFDARILAVCDVYDALISRRVYRDAWPHERAVALLREESGTSFDAKCVAALERVLSGERMPAAAAV